MYKSIPSAVAVYGRSVFCFSQVVTERTVGYCENASVNLNFPIKPTATIAETYPNLFLNPDIDKSVSKSTLSPQLKYHTSSVKPLVLQLIMNET